VSNLSVRGAPKSPPASRTGTELPPQYRPQEIEAPLYRRWLEAGLFTARRPRGVAADKPGYVVMMPPPNVTAVLHMGHGLNNAVQDALIRFERMRGKETLWLPGTDHAGIATQNVVERLIAKEGKTRFDLGRAAFVERVWAHVRETGSVILDQLKAIGSSCDWSRTYFTMDEGLSRAVRECFVQLHEKGLIYRGHYIINWCPRCLTALSNEEAEKEETDGRLWYFRYPLVEGSGAVTVATTRPETMLGDTAVAVHPDDDRYKGLVGRKVRLPLTEREVPIVADDAIDPAFGTGAVKVTPAHDPLDFEIAQRHQLQVIDIFTPEAKLAETVPLRFQGMDRFEARKRVAAEIESLGLLEKTENHRHAVGHCYRCDTVVEPRLSDQWFVKMAPLARPALAAYRTGRLRFIPERRGEEYANWMENIRDWCISRQLWWGHRIPVWYCDAPGCGKQTVSRTDLTRCPGCGGTVRQDEDVLDTWFSSWLVPFSSLGWPDRTADLAAFYPGDTLVTAPEILFFWVARMVMAGQQFMGDVPFTTVYLHGTVRDTQHRKMSKSLGNGIDPLDVVERYGADALRYTIIAGMGVGTDLILDPDDLETSFAPGRNFANKLWNAARFILSNLDGPTRPLAGRGPNVVRRQELGLADRWIIARCDATVAEVTEAYAKFRLSDAASAIYHFVWSDLADWYLEQIKPRLYGDQAGGDVARAVVARVFEVALQLLHPIMPFITESLWQRMPGWRAGTWLCTTPWPRRDDRASDPKALVGFAKIQSLVNDLRSLRSDFGIDPAKELGEITIPEGDEFIMQEQETVERLVKGKVRKPPLAPGQHVTGSGGLVLSIAPRGIGEVTVKPGEAIDIPRECSRLTGEIDRLARLVASQEAKLDNQQFVSRAPRDVVERERQKLADWQEQQRVLSERRRRLGCT